MYMFYPNFPCPGLRYGSVRIHGCILGMGPSEIYRILNFRKNVITIYVQTENTFTYIFFWEGGEDPSVELFTQTLPVPRTPDDCLDRL